MGGGGIPIGGIPMPGGGIGMPGGGIGMPPCVCCMMGLKGSCREYVLLSASLQSIENYSHMWPVLLRQLQGKLLIHPSAGAWTA